MGMMKIVDFSPVFKGQGAKNTTNPTYNFISFFISEERLVPAIMLNNENSNEEEGIDQTQSYSDPDGPAKTKVHEYPKAYKGKK